MKVAQLIFAGSFAGAEAVACSLTKALGTTTDRSILYLVQEKRLGATLCTELVSRAKEYDIEVRLFETNKRFCAKLADQLQRAFDEDGIDLLHAHSYKAALYGWSLARKMPKPLGLVFTVHGFDQSSWKGAAFLHTVNGLSAFSSDQVICVSDVLGTYYKRLPRQKNKVHVIANAAVERSAKTFDEQRQRRDELREKLAAKHGLDPNNVWCACIGRLVPVKNHQLFLDVAMACKDHDPAMQFLIAGDGPLKEQLIAQKQQLGAKHVFFTGHVHDMSEFYQALDILVLTSHSEGSPMVVLEAMNHGLPVVATRVGGVPDLIEHEISGTLFAPDDGKSCAAHLQRLASNPELREQLGRKAYQRINEQFNADQWAKQHLHVYQRALAGNPANR